MKKISHLILALAFLGAIHARAYTCPTGYTPIGDKRYSDGMGVGSDVPTKICYQYPYNNDYSQAGFYWHTKRASSSLVLPSDLSSGGGYNAGLSAYDPAQVTDHYVVVPKVIAGGRTQWYFASCAGTNCYRNNVNTRRGGWSAAPWKGTATPFGYTMTASGVDPTPPAGTLQWSIYVEGAPTVPAGHMALAEIGQLWQAGTKPSTDSYAVQVDGKACPAAYGGCTVNGITVEMHNTSGAYTVSSRTHDWNYQIKGTQFFFYNWSARYCTQELVLNIGASVSGAHSVTVTGTAYDSGGNPVGNQPSATYNFTVKPVSPIPYQAPSSYPAIPGVANYIYYLAGSGGNGYVSVANTMLSKQVTSPGSYFNDASGAISWTYWLGFYDVGRFAQQFADMLGSCNATSIVPCPGWTPGSKTQGRLINNTSCFLDVQTAGRDSKAPRCPASPGQSVTNGSVTYVSLGTQAWWRQLAQNLGDQYRNTNLLQQQWLIAQEWAIFAVGLTEQYFRRTTAGNVDQLDANAVQYLLYPFVTGNGAAMSGLVVWDNKIPLGTIRQHPLDLLALDAWWRISGTKPVDAGGVDLVQRWSDIMVNTVYRFTSCAPSTTNITTAGFPYCANNIQIGTPSFDIALIAESLKETCQVEQELGSGCDPAIPPALLALLDWTYSQEILPNINNWRMYTEPYFVFQLQTSPQVSDFNQSSLDNMLAPSYAWMGAWCGNCNLPTSGVPVWTAGDQLFANTFQVALWSGLPKTYGQVYFGFSNYVHYRTNPANGGWTAMQSEMSAALNPHDSNYPNKLGPYPEMWFPYTTGAATSGTVNTSNTTVTWVSGLQFSPTWINRRIRINGAEYTVRSVASPTSLTLATSAGTLTGASYSMPTPGCTATGGGTATCSWWSAPTASSYVRYAPAPNDPWAATMATGPAGTNCNTSANLCLNTVHLSGLAAGTYNMAFGGTDSAGNTAQSEVNYFSGSGGHFRMTIPQDPSPRGNVP